jgi:hypothetical protein
MVEIELAERLFEQKLRVKRIYYFRLSPKSVHH